MKILLYDASIVRHEYNEPIGLEIIANFIKNKFPSILVDVKTCYIENLTKLDDMDKYQIIGLSLPYNSIDSLNYVYNKLNFKKQKLIIGNSLSTFGYEKILYQFPKIICTLGEGEYAMEDLIEYYFGKIKLNNIRNIAYLKDNKIITNQKIILDKNDIIKPYRSSEIIKQIKNNNGTFRIEASRGCSYGKCSFCYIQGKYHNFLRREVSIDKIIKQIEYLDKLGIKTPYFTDEDFIGGNFSRVQRIADNIYQLKCNKKISKDMTFYFNATVSDILNPKWKETAKSFINAGMNQIFIGIESGSQTQLKRFNKPTTVDKNISALKILDNFGFNIEVGYIFFDPFSSIQELQESINFIFKTKLFDKRVQLFDKLKINNLSKFHNDISNTKIKLKDMNINDISYEYEFLDKNVQHVWSLFYNWKNCIEINLYKYQLKTRGENKNTEISNKLKKLNYIEFKVMKNICGL